MPSLVTVLKRHDTDNGKLISFTEFPILFFGDSITNVV